MVVEKLAEEVLRKCSHVLSEMGFSKFEESHDPANFGNSSVSLKSPVLFLRFLRDRDEVFVEIASPTDPSSWWDLDLVSRLLDEKSGEPVLSSVLSHDVTELCNFLKDRYARLAELFAPERIESTKRDLQRLGKLRAQQMFEGFVPS